MSNTLGFAGIIAFFAFVLTSVAAWFTHLYVSAVAIFSAGSELVLQGIAALIAGVIFPPLAAIHGVLVWFGAGVF